MSETFQPPLYANDCSVEDPYLFGRLSPDSLMLTDDFSSRVMSDFIYEDCRVR